MKHAALGFLCLLLSCCTVEWKHDPPGEPVSTIEVYDSYGEPSHYESCWDEPYLYLPEWCDWYGDGTTCCVWWVEDSAYWYYGGWYEEWCQWEDGVCWEYSGSW